ncbi:MAG: hypothetical protein F6K56_37990 [Moorea sp. SIO3G5]|nr:hypothetical protein [Moorena sp. SIO3G5]
MGYSSLFPVPCSLFPKTRNFVPHQIENRYTSYYEYSGFYFDLFYQILKIIVNFCQQFYQKKM